MTDLLANPFMRHVVWSGLILPGLATLAAGLILLALARGTQNRGIGSLWSLPMLAGLLTGYFSVYHDWAVWPHTVLGWLPALIVATVLLAGWTAHRNGRLGWLVAALLAGAASGAMLDPVLRQTTILAALFELAGVAILWWLLWVGSASGHGDQRGAAASQLVLAAGLVAAIGPLSQSILLGQLAMVFGASWAVVISLSWLFRADIPLSAPVADLGALMLGILCIELWYYDAAPWRVVLALLIATVIGAAAHRLYQRLPAARLLPGLLIPAAATALPTVIGVYFAWQAYATSGGG